MCYTNTTLRCFNTSFAIILGNLLGLEVAEDGEPCIIRFLHNFYIYIYVQPFMFQITRRRKGVIKNQPKVVKGLKPKSKRSR